MSTSFYPCGVLCGVNMSTCLIRVEYCGGQHEYKFLSVRRIVGGQHEYKFYPCGVLWGST